MDGSRGYCGGGQGLRQAWLSMWGQAGIPSVGTEGPQTAQARTWPRQPAARARVVAPGPLPNRLRRRLRRRAGGGAFPAEVAVDTGQRPADGAMLRRPGRAVYTLRAAQAPDALPLPFGRTPVGDFERASMGAWRPCRTRRQMSRLQDMDGRMHVTALPPPVVRGPSAAVGPRPRRFGAPSRHRKRSPMARRR